MKTIRRRITRRSNPKKTFATVSFHGRTRKEAVRNARAFAQKYHLPWEKDLKGKKKKKR